MRYLLDVSVLLAWGWTDHTLHERVIYWIEWTKGRRQTWLLTSAIPELGFVRISVQRTGGIISVERATDVLRGMLGSLGNRHEFLADDLPSSGRWPGWCDNAAKTTDSHLLALAEKHGAQLATLDTGIPGATLIPSVRP